MFPFLCSGGTVAGSITGLTITDAGTATVDFTALGGADYHIFDVASALNVGQRKSGGGSTITVAEYDPSTVYTPDSEAKSRTASATDATPTSSFSDNDVWRLFNPTQLAEGGVRVTLPAGTGSKTAKIYVMAFHSTSTDVRFQAVATLSDASFGPVTTDYAVPSASTDYYLRIDVTYNAASASQTLELIWKFTAVGSIEVRTAQYLGSWVST